MMKTSQTVRGIRERKRLEKELSDVQRMAASGSMSPSGGHSPSGACSRSFSTATSAGNQNQFESEADGNSIVINIKETESPSASNRNSINASSNATCQETGSSSPKAGGSDSLISACLVNDDLQHWKGKLIGPPGTVYEGGVYFIDIQIPPDYPYVPPKMKFLTKIWHPNISSQTGAICLDVLGKEWSPALTIRTALLSIQALLSMPEPDDPQDAQVAEMFKNDLPNFKATAVQWTKAFADPTIQESTDEEKIKRVCEMGFPRDVVIKTLKACQWDETRTINKLLEG